ncbi:MAG: hypothetical protein ABIK90_03530 [candidate division WOR-3 bacterium]
MGRETLIPLFLKVFKEARLVEGWTPELDELLAQTGIISNFTCGPQLLTFGVKRERGDVLITFPWKGEQRFLLLRERKISEGDLPVREDRILFHRRAKKMNR